MQPFSRIIAIRLLSIMVAAGAGATCFLAASAAPSHSAGCHPARVPGNPPADLPANYHCCASTHASALTTDVFSSRPTLQAPQCGAIDLLQTARESNALPTMIPPSGGPPASRLSGSSRNITRHPSPACASGRSCLDDNRCASQVRARFFVARDFLRTIVGCSVVVSVLASPAPAQDSSMSGMNMQMQMQMPMQMEDHESRSCLRRMPGRERAGSRRLFQGMSGC